MKRVEQKIWKKLVAHKDLIQQATPGLCLQVYEKGKKQVDLRWGDHYRFYDLASLTKILFTATICARLVGQKKLKPDQRVINFWPEFSDSRLQMDQLWTHTAGLPWWEPLFKKINRVSLLANKTKKLELEILRIVKNRKKKRHPLAVYSDPDLLCIGVALSHLTNKTWSELFEEHCPSDYVGDMHFCINNEPRFKASLYAPTENCKWRKKILRGQVHDENAYALGGVAPHAGLFGSIEDVALWALSWRKSMLALDQNWIRPSVAQMFSKRQIKKKQGDWGFLFMKPSRPQSSAGKWIHPSGYGHTGFTGTSLWIDPHRDRIVILLSNRVHPSRDNKNFVALRPQIHDWVNEVMDHKTL